LNLLNFSPVSFTARLHVIDLLTKPFLLFVDHGVKEGTFTRVKEDLQTSSDNLVLPPRAVSPSGRVVLRGGGGLANANSQSAAAAGRLNGSTGSAGFKEGNTFVRIDDQGNHLVSKMTKAKDSETWRP
jgi:hypothetical protein